MSRVCYTVQAGFRDQRTADEYVAWLAGGHTREVVEGGATSAMIVRLDPEASGNPRVVCQYIFPSRSAFDSYVAHTAPRLRADGLAKFPAERGVTFSRTLGEVIEA